MFTRNLLFALGLGMSLLIPATLAVSLSAVIAFLLFQRQCIDGLMTGASKG